MKNEGHTAFLQVKFEGRVGGNTLEELASLRTLTQLRRNLKSVPLVLTGSISRYDNIEVGTERG
jgi:hypothetical protein